MRGFNWSIHPEITEYMESIHHMRLSADVTRMVNERFGTDFRVTQIRAYFHNRNIPSGLTRSKKGARFVWTEEADELLVRLKDLPNGEIAKAVSELRGRPITEEAVSHRKTRLGVRSVNTGKYEKGHVPEFGYEKGHIPYSWVPVGTETERDGYVYVKVSDTPLAPQSENWKRKHVLIWEQHHGPIPEGMNVAFMDGNRQNFDIGNLMLISNEELGHLCKTERVDQDITRGRVLEYRLKRALEDKEQ